MSGTCLGALRGKTDFWANSGVCSNYHFAIAHPLHPLHPWGWGLQGVSFSLHPWRGGSHAFKTTKLLTVITFDHFHNRNPYSYEHSSFYTLPFIQSPWGADQPQSQLAPFQAQTLLGCPKGKILMSGTCLGPLRGENDFWANLGVCNNYHFAIAHPLHPLHPWGWGLQGVSFSLHP